MNDTQDDIKDEAHDECQDETQDDTLYDASFQILIVLVKRNDFRSLFLENMNEVKTMTMNEAKILGLFLKLKLFLHFHHIHKI